MQSCLSPTRNFREPTYFQLYRKTMRPIPLTPSKPPSRKIRKGKGMCEGGGPGGEGLLGVRTNCVSSRGTQHSFWLVSPLISPPHGSSSYATLTVLTSYYPSPHGSPLHPCPQSSTCSSLSFTLALPTSQFLTHVLISLLTSCCFTLTLHFISPHPCSSGHSSTPHAPSCPPSPSQAPSCSLSPPHTPTTVRHLTPHSVVLEASCRMVSYPPLINTSNDF